MLNKVIITGRLVSDPELRYTPSNKAVATARIASPRDYKNQNGERETDFINLVIWGKAENFANWIKKGYLVTVEGRLQTRSYENQQGQRVYVTEVVAENFQMLESRAAREGSSANQGNYNNQANNFQQGNSYQNGNGQGGYSQQPQQTPNFSRNDTMQGNPLDINDDLLPF